MEEEWVKAYEERYVNIPECMNVSSEIKDALFRSKEMMEKIIEDPSKKDEYAQMIDTELSYAKILIEVSKTKCYVDLDKLKPLIEDARRIPDRTDLIIENIMSVVSASNLLFKILSEQSQKQRYCIMEK